jgi:hypothetical protein
VHVKTGRKEKRVEVATTNGKVSLLPLEQSLNVCFERIAVTGSLTNGDHATKPEFKEFNNYTMAVQPGQELIVQAKPTGGHNMMDGITLLEPACDMCDAVLHLALIVQRWLIVQCCYPWFTRHGCICPLLFTAFVVVYALYNPCFMKPSSNADAVMPKCIIMELAAVSSIALHCCGVMQLACLS